MNNTHKKTERITTWMIHEVLGQDGTGKPSTKASRSPLNHRARFEQRDGFKVGDINQIRWHIWLSERFPEMCHVGRNGRCLLFQAWEMGLDWSR